MTTVFFIHGKESGPDGLKIQAMRRAVEALGFATEAPDFRFSHDPEARATHLLARLSPDVPVVMVMNRADGTVFAEISRFTMRRLDARTSLAETAPEIAHRKRPGVHISLVCQMYRHRTDYCGNGNSVYHLGH